MDLGLTRLHKEEFERDGYTIVRCGFTTGECDEYVHYMMGLHNSEFSVEGFNSHGPDDWGRLITRNCHNPLSLRWMLDPRLRDPLCNFLGDEPDGVQSMYFFKGSGQRRHQDNYFLPGCMSVWVALQTVGPPNGTIHVQVGSHNKPLIQKKDFREDEHGTLGPWHGWNPDDAFDEQFERNGLPEIPIEASKGDIVFFDGGIIHRGGPVEEPNSFRHSWAGHYIPQGYNPWPYESWPRLRISFDGVCRFTPTE